MATNAFPLDLGNGTLGVDCLLAAAILVAFQLITFGVEYRSLSYYHCTSQVPTARFGVLGDLAPDFVRLFLAGKANVAVTNEIATVFSSC